MKQIKAYIRPYRVRHVAAALTKIKDADKLVLFDVPGFGHAPVPEGGDGHNDGWIGKLPYTKIEVLCPDDWEFEIIMTIKESASTGGSADGTISVSEVERTVNIGPTGSPELKDGCQCGEKPPTINRTADVDDYDSLRNSVIDYRDRL